MAATEEDQKRRRSESNRRYYEKTKDRRVLPVKARQPRTSDNFEITESFLALSRVARADRSPDEVFRPTMPAYPPGVVPAGQKASLAMDSAFSSPTAWAVGGYPSGLLPGGQIFLGYPYLAELALNPEYRKASETIGKEMTRRWIKFQAVDGDDGGEDKSEKIRQLTDAFDRYHVRDLFRKAAELVGFFGRAHLFIDLGSADGNELTTSIGDGRNDATKGKITKGSLKAIKVVEPYWCYPQGYNTTNPLEENWYVPQQWGVMGRPVHHTRLLTMVFRPVPDILKPAYQFGGLSLSQIMKPYVDRFTQVGGSVANLVQAFSTLVFKTNMADVVGQNPNGNNAIRRAQVFQNLRDNLGLLICDKDKEDLANVSAPLGGLDHLQAQSQEQMASIVSIPLVKFLGITPSGLNASSDGEIRCFYDDIHAAQEAHFSPPLDTIFNLIQLSEFGEIDEGLTYKFEPLWTLDDKELAEVNEIEARTDVQLVDAGIITVEEARKRLAADPEVPYDGLDPDDLPELPEPELELEPPSEPGQPEQEEHRTCEPIAAE